MERTRSMQRAAASTKFGVAGVGHLGRQIEEGLLAVTKMRGDDELAGFSEAEAAAQMLEAALHGERGRGEHDGGDLVEDQLADERGDVDGRGLEESGGTACGSPLDWLLWRRSGCGDQTAD